MKCKWHTNDRKCDGKVERIDLFPSHTENAWLDGESVHDMPICEVHRKDHENIMRLHACGVEAEKILAMSGDERKYVSSN